jgi:hypothetical protein
MLCGPGTAPGTRTGRAFAQRRPDEVNISTDTRTRTHARSHAPPHTHTHACLRRQRTLVDGPCHVCLCKLLGGRVEDGCQVLQDGRRRPACLEAAPTKPQQVAPRERSVPQRGARELYFLPPLEIPRREVGRGVPEEAGDDVSVHVYSTYVRTHTHTHEWAACDFTTGQLVRTSIQHHCNNCRITENYMARETATPTGGHAYQLAS